LQEIEHLQIACEPAHKLARNGFGSNLPDEGKLLESTATTPISGRGL